MLAFAQSVKTYATLQYCARSEKNKALTLGMEFPLIVDLFCNRRGSLGQLNSTCLKDSSDNSEVTRMWYQNRPYSINMAKKY